MLKQALNLISMQPRENHRSGGNLSCIPIKNTSQACSRNRWKDLQCKHWVFDIHVTSCYTVYDTWIYADCSKISLQKHTYSCVNKLSDNSLTTPGRPCPSILSWPSKKCCQVHTGLTYGPVMILLDTWMQIPIVISIIAKRGWAIYIYISRVELGLKVYEWLNKGPLGPHQVWIFCPWICWCFDGVYILYCK